MDDARISEAIAILGAEPESAGSLLHGRRTGVTREVRRVVVGDRSAVLKVVSPGHGDPGWLGSHRPDAARYWKREVLLYEHGMFEEYLDAGLRPPRLLGTFERPGGEVALWLEDVRGVPGVEWDLGRHAATARRLGRAQGAFLAGRLPAVEWLSRRFLHEYLDSWATVPWRLLDDAAWAAPLVARHAPPGLRDAMRRLHEERDRFLAMIDAAPRTICHLDFWPANLFDGTDEVVAIDWAFAGLGAPGEDIGNLVPDTVFDLWQPAAILGDLDQAVYAAYVEGLHDAGWTYDERTVRLAMCAAAVKYDWLTPHMLALAPLDAHEAYGRPVSSDLLFAERFAALDFLAARADEARRLAGMLGL